MKTEHRIANVARLLHRAVNHYGDTYFDGNQMAYLEAVLDCLEWTLAEDGGGTQSHAAHRFADSINRLHVELEAARKAAESRKVTVSR